MLEICNRFSLLDQMLRTETYVSFTSSFAFYWRKRGIKVVSTLSFHQRKFARNIKKILNCVTLLRHSMSKFRTHRFTESLSSDTNKGLI